MKSKSSTKVAVPFVAIKFCLEDDCSKKDGDSLQGSVKLAIGTSVKNNLKKKGYQHLGEKSM